MNKISLRFLDVPATAYDTVIGIAEIAPNTMIGRRTHPGSESGYLLEGDFPMLADGDTGTGNGPYAAWSRLETKARALVSNRIDLR